MIEKTLNKLIADLSSPKEDRINTGLLSDGYHSFDDLYKHRNLLFVHLAKLGHEAKKFEVWRSVKNSDGSMWKGWFVMGIHKEEGKQITYHLPIEFWDHTMFAETLDKGLWDGHSSHDVVDRLILQL